MAAKQEKKRVLVVGAGAAGMSCADSLAKHPDRFDVTLVDAVGYCGGQAFSIDVDKEKFGASWINQGVQGGSPIFHHTNRMFEQQGMHSDPVKLHVGFGKDESFWSNAFPTHLLQKHGSEIKRFLKVIKFIHYLRPFFALMSIKTAMSLFWFSNDFVGFIVLPMIALFLGTGNATPEVPVLIVETLITNPSVGMWYPGDSASMVSNEPPMIVFPQFSKFYGKWEEDLRNKGVHIRLNTELLEVVERTKKGVKVSIKNSDGSQGDESFDELVLCSLADTSLRLLGRTARWLDRKVLGSAKFSDDITVTHCDSDYMKKRYVLEFDEEQAIESVNGADAKDRVENARKNYKPMYLITQQREDKKEPEKIDMAFDCSNYQTQLDSELPLDRHIYQTIFLNSKDEKNWTRDQINKDKIIQESWWHQLCHSTSHYAKVVPWMWLLNGVNSTTFAGSWTLVNAHEVAIVSGLAAAYRLGAPYPEDLEADGFAYTAFKAYTFLTHGRWHKKGENRQ